MHVMMNSWLGGTSVPPRKYGGIERFVATLTRELVKKGHRVTLIAPPGSYIGGAEVIGTTDFNVAYDAIRQLRPDVLHDHSCWSLDSPVRRPLSVPFISTTHVNHAIGWTKNVVYLSASQRWQHAIQVGKPTTSGDFMILTEPVIPVPTDPSLKPKGLPRKDYFLYLGSVAPHKGVHRAAELAHQMGARLIVAGPAAGEYADKVASMPGVEMVGEVGDPYRSELLEQARAVMCLHGDENGWHEPGCGVVGEAGAFNTPVVALANGCLREIVVNAENGWIERDMGGVVNEMLKNPTLPNVGHKAQVEWSAARITHKYIQLYNRVIEGKTWA